MADKHIDSPDVTWISRTFGKDAPHDAPIPSAKRAFADVYMDRFWGDGRINKERIIFPLIAAFGCGGVGVGMLYDAKDTNIETHVTPPAVEQSLSQGILQDGNGYLPFDYDGTDYLLVQADEQYRLYENSGQGFIFETDAEDAFFVLKNAGETLSDYAAAMADPALDIPDTRIDLKQVASLSERYDGSPAVTTIERDVAGWSDYEVPAGENIAQHFAQIGGVLENVAHSSINGAYGMEAGFDAQPLETSTEQVVEVDQGMIIGSYVFLTASFGALLLFPAIATGQAISAGVSAANAGRRERKAKKKNRPTLTK